MRVLKSWMRDLNKMTRCKVLLLKNCVDRFLDCWVPAFFSYSGFYLCCIYFLVARSLQFCCPVFCSIAQLCYVARLFCCPVCVLLSRRLVLLPSSLCSLFCIFWQWLSCYWCLVVQVLHCIVWGPICAGLFLSVSCLWYFWNVAWFRVWNFCVVTDWVV